jgi:hypothetical protein
MAEVFLILASIIAAKPLINAAMIEADLAMIRVDQRMIPIDRANP